MRRNVRRCAVTALRFDPLTMTDQLNLQSVLEQLALAGWLLFVVGMLVLTLVGMGRIPPHYGRAGICALLTGAVVIITSPPWQLGLLVAGLAVAALQLRRSRSKAPLWNPTRRRHEPWDQEAALLRLCGGDRAVAERLIRHEIERNPSLSRAGAALAAATRLRHER